MEKSQSPFIGRDNGTKESMRTESLPLPGSIAYGDLPQFPKHGVLPFRRTIRRHELRQIVPLAETTIYEMERRGEFPRRFNLTPRCVVWDLAEVEAWIEVSVGGRLRRFITSLLCPRTHPAQELAELYHQRWEIELAYGEMKTDMLGQAMTLRSQQPDGVKQELGNLADVQPDPLGDHAHRRRGQSAALSHQLHHGAALHRG